MKTNLKTALHDYYCNFSLSEEQLETLRSVAQDPKTKPKRLSWLNKSWLIPASCGFAMALILTASFYLKSLKPLNQRIASEVAYNHNKAMPSEVLTQDYNVINEALDRLDFKVQPSKILASNYQLIGGRYCSVQGKIAAQLKLKNKVTGQEATLYQFKAVDLKELGPSPTQLQQGEVQIKIWKEGQLGFAIAQ